MRADCVLETSASFAARSIVTANKSDARVAINLLNFGHIHSGCVVELQCPIPFSLRLLASWCSLFEQVLCDQKNGPCALFDLDFTSLGPSARGSLTLLQYTWLKRVHGWCLVTLLGSRRGPPWTTLTPCTTGMMTRVGCWERLQRCAYLRCSRLGFALLYLTKL